MDGKNTKPGKPKSRHLQATPDQRGDSPTARPKSHPLPPPPTRVASVPTRHSTCTHYCITIWKQTEPAAITPSLPRERSLARSLCSNYPPSLDVAFRGCEVYCVDAPVSRDGRARSPLAPVHALALIPTPTLANTLRNANLLIPNFNNRTKKRRKKTLKF